MPPRPPAPAAPRLPSHAPLPLASPAHALAPEPEKLPAAHGVSAVASTSSRGGGEAAVVASSESMEAGWAEALSERALALLPLLSPPSMSLASRIACCESEQMSFAFAASYANVASLSLAAACSYSEATPGSSPVSRPKSARSRLPHLAGARCTEVSPLSSAAFCLAIHEFVVELDAAMRPSGGCVRAALMGWR